MKLRILITALILFGFANVSVAGECKIRVEFNAGSAFSPNNITLPERTYQPGGWQSFSQEHITKIENTGRNDMLIRTRNVITNQIAEYHTVNNGSLTIWLPLPNFSGTALHEIRCLNYSTIHDATDVLSEFGGGAQNLINQTEAAALQMVQDSKNSLLAMADPATYQTFMQDLNQQQQQVEQKWQELQQLAAEGMDVADLLLSEHFPELHAAIEASNNVTVDLQWALLGTHGNNLQALQQKLREIDQKLGASDLAGELASINPEDHFPELFALGRTTCEIDPAFFNETASEMNRFHNAFSLFMEELANQAELPDIPFSQSDIDQLNRLLTRPTCLDELDEARRLLVNDLQSFAGYVQSVQENLEIWQRRWFIRGHEDIFQESQRLAQTSAVLAEHLAQQHVLEQEANQAKREMDENHERIGRIHGREGHTIDLLVVRVDLLVPTPEYLFAPNDKEQLERQIEAQDELMDHFEDAILARENNLQQIQHLSADWLRDVSSLAASVSGIRIAAPTVRRFIDLANIPPVLNLPGSSARLLQSCLTGINQNLQTASGIFNNGFRTFYSDLANFAESMVPEQLAITMEYYQKALLEHEQGIEKLQALRRETAALLFAYRSVKEANEGLWSVILSDPANPIYSQLIDSNLDRIRESTRELTEAKNRFDIAYENARPDFQAYTTLLAEIRISLEENQSDLTRAGLDLLNFTVNFSSLYGSFTETHNFLNQCFTQTLILLTEAASSFDQRKIAFAMHIQELLPDPIPDEVRSGISNLTRLTGQQISDIMNHHLVIFEKAKNQQITMMSVAHSQSDFLIFTTLLQTGNQEAAFHFLNQAVERIQNLEIETNELRHYLQTIANNHNEAVQELRHLKEWARTSASDVASDITDLQLAVLNISPILQNTDQILAIIPLWTEAMHQTPLRMEALATNEIAQRLEQLRPQVESGMQHFLSHSAASVSCAQEVISQRTNIAGQSIQNSVNQALSNIVGTAPVIYTNLQNLLNPVQSAMTGVEQVLNSGKSLIQEAQQAPQMAKNNFENAVSSSKNLMQQSMTCVNQRSEQIQSQINELNSMFAEIEGFQSLQPVQMQFISFPIQN